MVKKKIKKKVKRKIIKKKPSIVKDEKDPVYVQLNNPVDNRKLILKTAISAAKLIQDYEVIKALKLEKINVYKKFTQVLGESKKIHKKIINFLPQLKEEKKVEVKGLVVKKEHKDLPATIIKDEIKPLSDVEKLQQQLSDIEGQLAKL